MKEHPKKYRIETIADLIELIDDRTKDDIAGSLSEWVHFIAATKEMDGVKQMPYVDWVDDGEGRVSGVTFIPEEE